MAPVHADVVVDTRPIAWAKGAIVRLLRCVAVQYCGSRSFACDRWLIRTVAELDEFDGDFCGGCGRASAGGSCSEDGFVAFEEGLVEAVKGHEPSPVERLVVLAVVGHMRLM